MPKIFAYIQFLSFCLPELSTVFLQTGDKSFFSLRSHGTGKFLINFARTDVLYENRFRLLRAHSIAVLHREDLQGACPPQWFYCYARNRVLIAGKVFALALCSRYVGAVALWFAPCNIDNSGRSYEASMIRFMISHNVLSSFKRH